MMYWQIILSERLTPKEINTAMNIFSGMDTDG
jgi:hypothetical protein